MLVLNKIFKSDSKQSNRQPDRVYRFSIQCESCPCKHPHDWCCNMSCNLPPSTLPTLLLFGAYSVDVQNSQPSTNHHTEDPTHTTSILKQASSVKMMTDRCPISRNNIHKPMIPLLQATNLDNISVSMLQPIAAPSAYPSAMNMLQLPLPIV